MKISILLSRVIGLLALIAISHAGYLTYKAVKKNKK